MSSKFLWQSGDLQLGWLALATPSQRTALIRLLATAQRSREEQANAMLDAPPRPTDETDAKARATAVIRYLTGYRVGDRHPSTEAG